MPAFQQTSSLMSSIFLRASLSAVCILAFAAEVRGQDDKVGQYFCYVEHAAGILHYENKPTFSGQVALAENQRKFFITIKPVVRSANPVCRQSLEFFANKIERGEAFSANDAPSGPGLDKIIQPRQSLGRMCLTMYELSLKYQNDDHTWTFRSYGATTEFYGAMPQLWFALYGSRFQAGFPEAGIREGICERIVPPK